MVNPEVAVPLAIGITIVVGLVFRRWRHRERIAEIAAGKGLPEKVEDRLTRLENGMDAIAVEIERVGEGQRYLTKLFTEQGRSLPSSSPGGNAERVRLE